MPLASALPVCHVEHKDTAWGERLCNSPNSFPHHAPTHFAIHFGGGWFCYQSTSIEELMAQLGFDHRLHEHVLLTVEKVPVVGAGNVLMDTDVYSYTRI